MERTAPQLWGIHAGRRAKISIDVKGQPQVAHLAIAGNIIVAPAS
jgi:hypothetical protein